MQLTTFSTSTIHRHVGVLIGDEIADLSAVGSGPATVVQLLSRPDWRTEVEALKKDAPHHPTTDVRLHARCPHQPNTLPSG